MKRYMIFALLIIVVSCKKKETEPTPPPTTVCETKSKVFEGKYEVMNNSKDTIIITFVKNNCPNEGVNTYLVYGLGKAFNNGTSSNIDEGKVYEITSNETNKTAIATGVDCKFGLGSGLSCDYENIGILYFKKL